jgi:kynurenine formamidase
MRIIDLSVPIGEATLSPPSVNLQLSLTRFHRGPGFWQASKLEMLLHTGSHVDFSRHVQADGQTAVDVRPGDIALVRTDWTAKHWGNFPTYYLESPFCAPEAAMWLVDRGAKAIGFDCFSEYCARLPDFTSEDFMVHKVILENGAILMQQMTNLSALPVGRHVQFFAPFIKIDGAEQEA